MGSPVLPDALAQFLARWDVPHRVVRHADLEGPVRSPADVAGATGLGLDRIAKTLLVVSAPDRLGSALVVLPVAGKVSFDRVAQALGWPGAALASPAELDRRLRQPIGGVSPLDAPPGFAVLVDRSLAEGGPVLVGAGVVGVEVALAAEDLVRAAAATVASVMDGRPRDSSD